MAQGNEEMIEVPSQLGVMLPEEGNTKVDPAKPLGGEGVPTGDLTPAEKLFLAEKEIARKEAEDKNKNKGKKEDTEDKEENEEEEEVEIPQEEIDAKLEELSKKEEKDLTDEDKEFIQKYSQEELDEINAVKADVEATYGIKLEGTYENSPEGLKQLNQDLLPKLVEQEFISSLQQVPYMKEFYQHITSGRSIETFLAKNEKPVFATIELKNPTEVDEAQKPNVIKGLKDMVTLDLKSKGVAEDTINDLVNLYEANGSLFDKAKAAKDALQKSHQANIDLRIKEEEAAIEAEKQEIAKQYAEVQNIIEKNDFGGVSIPAADVKAFKDAMLRSLDAQGNTLMDAKRAKITLAQRALMDYIIFKDFKVTGLVSKAPAKSFSFKNDNKANNKRAGGRLRNGSGGSTETTQKGHPNFDIKNTDFSKLNVQRQTIN